jgi:hypothetical protein
MDTTFLEIFFKRSTSRTVGFCSGRRCAHPVIRVCIGAMVVVAALTATYEPAQALVVTTTTLDTTQAPPGGPAGWTNVAQGGLPDARNFIYLGNGWALGAWHTGPFPISPDQTLDFSTGPLSVIPGQNYEVMNPTGMGLSAHTDLRLVRLNGEPNLPSITIATQALTVADLGQPQAEVTFIGQGHTREAAQTRWNSSWVESPTGSFIGYKTLPDITKRWGKNAIANENSLFGESDSDLRGTVFAAGRHVVSMITYFDQSGIDYEAQAVDLNSGTSVFRKNGSQWELIGIVNTIYTYTNQPVATAVFGNATTFADLTFYNQNYPGSISNIMSSHPNYSIVGDLNLDGVVSGNGAGSTATDDVAAFIQGWGSTQTQGNLTSWKKGDMNLDGTVNVTDFMMMRNALNGAGMGGGAEALAKAISMPLVPEPSTVVMTIVALIGLLLPRRRRM